MKHDVITIGGATEDINFYINHYHLLDNSQSASGAKFLAFDYGTKVDVKKTFASFGGGAANAAVTFASLGLKTACIVSCGKDERGKRTVANLKHRGVDVSLIKLLKHESSGYSFLIIGSNNEHIAFSYRAANNKLSLSAKQIAKLAVAEWLYVTSMSGDWDLNLQAIFALSETVAIAWNPGQMQLDAGFAKLKKYLAKTAVLCLNKDEAVKLLVSHPEYRYKPYDFLVSSQNLLRAIRSWGPKIVVITNGEKGADAYDGQHYYHQEIINLKKKADTTGLGDAFGSAFIAGLKIFQADIKRALYLAAYNSASVLSVQGAQNGVLTKQDLAKIMTKSYARTPRSRNHR